MVDIQSPTTENRHRKKRRRKKIETTAAKYNGLPNPIDWPQTGEQPQKYTINVG